MKFAPLVTEVQKVKAESAKLADELKHYEVWHKHFGTSEKIKPNLKMSKLHSLDLFSGVGGNALALLKAAYCEIEPFAVSGLEACWSRVRCHQVGE